MDTLFRALIALGMCTLGLGAYWLWNGRQVARLRRKASLPGLETLRGGAPAILYFTTPDCVPCRTTQRPALARLQTELADGLQILEIDASARPGVADYWGVLSVPTTFVIDTQGRPRRVNHGVTSAEKLKQQIEEVAGDPGSRGSRLHPARGRLSLDP